MGRIGVLTSGGDCPGLNAAILGLVESVERAGSTPVLIADGFRGLLNAADDPDASRVTLLARERISLSRQGGTVLGSSRTRLHGPDVDAALRGLARLGVDALAVIGGDGSLHSAHRLSAHIPVVALPKTIDNDVAATEMSIGFHTAVQTAVDAIDRLRDTASSHHSAFLVEVMGRQSGFLAAAAARAAHADTLVVPEAPCSLDRLQARLVAGSITVVAEGAWCDELGQGPVKSADGRLGGVADALLAALTSKVSPLSLRAVSLGHVLRGGAPVAADRMLATTMAELAAELLLAGKSGLCAQVNGQVVALDIDHAHDGYRVLSPSELERFERLLP